MMMGMRQRANFKIELTAVGHHIDRAAAVDGAHLHRRPGRIVTGVVIVMAPQASLVT